ncbi:MAG: ankyrin repeat domain-containing protein [Cyanobacteria bacterium P01_G01_bin.54]
MREINTGQLGLERTKEEILFNAVSNQDIGLVKAIARQEFAIHVWAAETYNESIGGFLNPIQKAVHLKNKEILKILLKRIPNGEVREEHVCRALATASISGDLEFFGFLFDSFEVSFTSCRLGYVIDAAIWGGSLDILKTLIDAGADVNADVDNGKPLIRAVRKGDIRFVRLLVEAGADVDFISSVSPFCGALGQAAIERHQGIFDYLFPLVSSLEEKKWAQAEISGYHQS